MMSRIASILAGLLLLSSSALAATSTITGTVQNVDGSACANCTVSFNSQVTQVIGGVTYQPLLTSTNTDSNGNLTSISLPQGLVVQITVSENGQSFAPYSAIVPFITTVTFDQMNQGITTNPLNVLASQQPPTGPLSMNSQKITGLACPTNPFDAAAFGCDATFNNLTITGGFVQNTSGLAINGRFTDTQVGNPSAPTVTPIGTSGASTYQYFVVCHDGNFGTTLASAGTTITNGNATLNGTNYNQIAWTFPAHALNCDVLRGDTGHSAVGGLALTSSPFNDQTNTTNAYTAPTRNNTGDIQNQGYITSGPAAGQGRLVLGFDGFEYLDFGIINAFTFTFVGGPVNVTSGGISSGMPATGQGNGDLVTSNGPALGRLLFGSGGTASLDYGSTMSTAFSFIGGNLDLYAPEALVFNGSSSGSASISVGANAGSPATLVLPSTSGSSGGVMTTNGAGVLKWGAQPRGTCSIYLSQTTAFVLSTEEGDCQWATPVHVQEIHGWLETPPATCSPAGTIDIALGGVDQGATGRMTLVNAVPNYDITGINMAVPANTVIQSFIQTAPAGCGTAPQRMMLNYVYTTD